MAHSDHSDASYDPDLSLISTITPVNSPPRTTDHENLSRAHSSFPRSVRSSLPTPPGHSSPPLQGPDQPSSLPDPPFQIHPKFLINPHATEPSYFVRPNRYFGPESTWRSWTEADRAVHASVERSRSEDLSVHLYNAYALKRQSLRCQSTRLVEGTGQADNEGIFFCPPKVWTAWPLPPDQVPREQYLRSLDGPTTSLKDTRPSAELQECLVAITQQYARQRWDERAWEVGKGSTQGTEPNDSPEQARSGKDKNGDVDVSMQDNSEIKSRNGSPTTVSSQSSGSASPEDGIKYFSSQAFAATNSSSSSDGDSDPQEIVHRPVFTADDDRVRQLLLPSTRSLISKLDDVLEAVHQSRQAYAYGRGQQSRSRSQSRLSSEGEEETEDVAASIEKKGRKRRRETSTHPSSSPRKPRLESKLSDKLVSNSRSTSQSNPAPRSKSATLQPHDWSIIIGMASVVGGFSPSTIERASERCARLFDENMQFRTFTEATTSEDQVDSTTPSGKDKNNKPSFDEYFALDDDEHEEADLDKAYDEVNEENKSPKSTRISAACTRCHNRKLKCEPSTTRTITNDDDRTVSCKTCIKDSASCSGIQSSAVTQEEPSHNFACPHIHCERHTIPFQKPSNLRRHITLVHHGDTQLTIPTPSPSLGLQRKGSSTSIQSESIDTETFCPVKGCPRSGNGKGGGEPFKNGFRMYTHVRKMHPELDIMEVKKAEAQRRGERRGKWTDERRHRSRSQGAGGSGRSRGDDVDVDVDVDVDDSEE